MSKKGLQYLSLILLKSFGISCLLTFLTNEIINSKKNIGFDQKQGDFIELMAGLSWIFILTICTLPIYLNLKNVIRTKPLFRFFSFFLMPLVMSFLIWFLGDHSGQWISFYLNTFIFLFTLSFFYVRFLIKLNSTSSNL